VQDNPAVEDRAAAEDRAVQDNGLVQDGKVRDMAVKDQRPLQDERTA
jgi:hypothetical protein